LSQHFATIFVDREVADHPRLELILKAISFDRKVEVVGETHPGGGLLITRNRGKFIKPCPGQKGSVCCGYWVVEWGLGCPFQCEYCIIQNYLPARDLTLFINWEDCLEEIRELRSRLNGPIRLGTGQFGDPLALEEFFPLNRYLLENTMDIEDLLIEIKSKSDRIDLLPDVSSPENIVVAFSLNPSDIVSRVEHGTASLQARIAAAKIAVGRGFRVAFHFDPLLPVNGWEMAYRSVVESLAGIPVDQIAWFSLGTFRFPVGFPERVLACHPKTTLFREEFHPSFDGKIRMFRPYREEVYKVVKECIDETLGEVHLYLCMESPHVWERVWGEMWSSAKLKHWLDSSIAKFHGNRL